MQDPDFQPPVNPLPPVVILLFLAIAGVEGIFSLGEAGIVGGRAAIGWRLAAMRDWGFSGNVLQQMWTLGVWPPQVSAEGRVHVRDLPRNIERLTQYQSLRRLAKAAVMPASANEVPLSHLGAHLLDRGSAIVPADPKLQRCIPRKAVASPHSQIETLALASIERNAK